MIFLLLLIIPLCFSIGCDPDNLDCDGFGACDTETGICNCFGDPCADLIDNHCVLKPSCNCTLNDPTCSNRGTCIDSMCSCDIGWERATLCEKCRFGFYGPLCENETVPASCSDYAIEWMCSNIGSCVQTTNPTLDGAMMCLCPPGFVQYDEYSGVEVYYPTCDECIPDHYGPDCRQVNCTYNCGTHGECINYTSCQCHPGWNAATRCSTCLPTHFGTDCQFYNCSATGCSGHGMCNSNSQCQCSAGYYGTDCQYNTLYPIDTTPCNDGNGCGSHGICLSAYPNSYCACSGNFQGSKCDFCLPYYTGVQCIDLICDERCINGQCTYPDTCTCNFGYYGTDCELCDNNWIMCNLSEAVVAPAVYVNVWEIISTTTAIIILVACAIIILACVVILGVIIAAKIMKRSPKGGFARAINGMGRYVRRAFKKPTPQEKMTTKYIQQGEELNDVKIADIESTLSGEGI